MSSGVCTVNTVLVDLSGTIHIEDTEIPGSVKALERLQKSKVNIKFVTNTTKESKRVLIERLHSIGFSVKGEEIFTSLTAARYLIEQRKVHPLLMVDEKALEDFEGVSTENQDAVVVGLAPEKFDYNTMNQAFRLILGGAPLIAIHKGRYYKRKDGLALGPGPFVTALEFATGQKADIVGKPELSFFLSAVEEFSVIPSQCIMIGDDVYDDIGGSQNAGMQGILVKTGKYRDGDETKIHPPPCFVAKNFSEAVDFILTLIS